MTDQSIAEIDRETARISAEARKLFAEAEKLAAERWKLDAEERKLRRDHDLEPWRIVVTSLAAGAGFMAAAIAVTKLLLT